MSRRWVACLFLALSSFQVRAQSTPSQPCTPTVVGTVETFEFKSTVFDNTRTVRVLLPTGYADAANRGRHYPVLYMLDAQNLFDSCLAYDHVHEWQVDETAARLTAEGKIEPLIVVGIDHARDQRASDYLP